MSDPVPDAALWLVDDPDAAAVVEGFAPGRPTVRLDLPGWQVALGALTDGGLDGPTVGLAVGAAEDPASLGSALAAVAEASTIVLLLTRPDGDAASLTTALTWAGLGAETLRRIDLGTGPALLAELTGTGPLDVPLLAALAVPGSARSRPGVGWRVGIVGPDARAWLGGWVRAVALPRDAVDHLGDRFEHLDAVVVSPAEGWPDEQLGGVLRRAAELGAATVAVAPSDAAWAAGAAVHLSPDMHVRPVRIDHVNPQGWRRTTAGRSLAVVPGDDPRALETALAAVRDHLSDRPWQLLGTAMVGSDLDVPSTPVDGTATLQVLRNMPAVVDHPALHASDAAHASWLATLALAAVPVVCLDLPDSVAVLLGDRLAGAVRGTRLSDLDDPDERERRSVLARRAAWLEHSCGARWRELAPRLGLPVPRGASFSMVLATNRPDFLEHAVGQIARQTWTDAELVVALNGDDFPPDTAELIRTGTGKDATILQVPAREPLGGVLNRAIEVAGGEIITKVDDDDWYSPDHLVDLAMALEYSGAHLVGKAAEFVHLAHSDLTIRRFVTGAETASRTLAGGTLTVRRDVLRDVGGFLRVGIREDGALIDDILAAGGRIHRTHGFGYVLHRHGRHAWDADDAYFREQATAERPGLDHEWTLT